ncbi:hypothetical protein PENTCL1PPCAC_13587, partial [Pristionchus entomophagus]
MSLKEFTIGISPMHRCKTELLTLDFIRKIIDNFNIDKLHLNIQSQVQLDIALQLMADRPRSQWYSLNIDFLPGIDTLRSIPATNELTIYGAGNHKLIPAELFIELLTTHQSIQLGCDTRTVLTYLDEWEEALKV